MPWFLVAGLKPADCMGAAPVGDAGFFEGFEGPDPSWVEAGGDAPYVVQGHRRVFGVAHSGQGCEWLQLSAGQGGHAIYIAHDIGRPWVIEDLRPSLWVKSDRPGVQFVVEVVLPRTLDRRTGRPVVTHLWGAMYTEVGRWQQLAIGTLPQLLDRQLRILRSQLGTDVDGGQAYVSRVLLNIYSGPGISNVWIDELAAPGHVASGRGAADAAPPGPPGQATFSPAAFGPAGRQSASRSAAIAGNLAAADAAPREVQLAGATLLVRGQPMLPRAIQYRGEPLVLLKQLGFNTVWLTEVPPADLLAEAGRLGLWLVCPPPRPAPSATGGPWAIGAEFQPVLAWDLGAGLTTRQTEANRRWADEIRVADARQQRPLVACPANDFRQYSRHVDLLVIDRRPLGTSLEMPDYGVWVRRQPLLARPGTPVWTTIQTQPGEGLRRQLAALAPAWAPPTTCAPEQIELLVCTAVSSGSRGLLFLSQSPLSADDAETRQRAATLALLNLELDLIEPWVAAGTFVDMAQSKPRQASAASPVPKTSAPDVPASSPRRVNAADAKPKPSAPDTAASNPWQVSGAVLRSDRARLVLPEWLAPRSQCVVPEATANPLALVVPAIPESANAYELTSGRLEPLRRKREAGGTCVTLDEFHLTAMVLFAQDPLVIDAVSRRVAAYAKPSAELQRQLAGRKLETVGQWIGSFGSRLPATLGAAEALATARRELEQSDARLKAGDFPSASLHARRAMRPLRKLERAAWNVAMTGLFSPIASPGTASFATLPWHWNLMDRLRSCQAGPNRLPTGDFENPDLMRQSGWRYDRQAVPGVEAAADPMKEAAHSGRMGMRLTARADDPENPPAMVETPPVWITTPAVPVEPGQIVRIRGWVNIPAAITGSVDGLLVIDSLAGMDLAERIDKTAGWREFTLYRAVEQSGPMTVTFALSGLGEVRLDDVAVEVMQPVGGPVPLRPFSAAAAH
jgi:hypothetical protein